MSKIVGYENPYNVKGIIKLAGSEEKPKCIYVWIELMERGKQNTRRAYTQRIGENIKAISY